ncbi:thiamine-phosphate kinase [Marinagarivorans algicola]|uniref:thiamine-phosphate kinase n=1 Tax=Marinagarivorans algicola TaxID=1513270 RepID=UPI0006B96BC4|nr:thiamine-phosphate kinase [Marinagarivorans algicola]
MDEFALIRQNFAKAIINDSVALGIGDDCALLIPPAGKQLAVSMDTLVEGTHFPKGAPAKRIATRALATALSDLAAMGAEPLWFTLGLTLPNANQQWVGDFCDGLLEFADTHQCTLVGGDITRGPLTITVQVHGSITPGQALCRSGAQPDDIIYVTGSLGDGAAALAVLQQNITVRKAAQDYLVDRFYKPTPRIKEGRLLSTIAHAGIDISDGLYADLSHICQASGVGALIDVNRIPLSPYWGNKVSRDKALAWAISGGDDYELCVTVPRTQVATLETWIKSDRINATAIGKITHKPEIYMVNKGKTMAFDIEGYKHFE